MAATAAQVMVVPIDVVAYCVGTGDVQPGGTHGFAGATTVYETIASSGDLAAYLGSDVTKSLDDPPWKPLECGVHLHWALPDALTRATLPPDANGRKGQGLLNFPAVPNHWLVTRLVISGATPAIKSWVIESDALSETLPDCANCVTVPVKPATPDGQVFRYLGKHSLVETYSPPPNGERAFATMTGRELTAVASGMPTFAAFYPDCRSAFGFCDDFADLPATGAAINLMYVVTGWFDHPANDPVKPGVALHALRDSHRWVAHAEADPTQTLYNGFVQNVTWDKSRNYVYEQPALAPIKAEIAIGNSPAEAMAAFFREKVQPGVPLFESLLNALQFGLLDKFVEPQSDRLANLREALHEKEFVAADAGSIYVVVKPVPNASLTSAPQTDVLDLPLKLADDLNSLNILQQQYDLCRAHLAETRWQLFSDWYRIPLATGDTFEIAIRTARQRIAECKALIQTCQNLEAQRDVQLTNVVTPQLEPDFVLKAIPAERYWQPTEPSVLISSPQLAFPGRYGGDSTSGDGGLACRMGDQLVTAVTVNGQPLAADRFATIAQGLLSTKISCPDVCVALIAEACLLNSSLLGAITGQPAADLQTAIDPLIKGSQPAQLQASGKLPSPVAVNWWDGNPWLPIFLRWSTQLTPQQPTAALQDYKIDFFTANYTVDPMQGGFVAATPNGAVIDPQGAEGATAGWALLSPTPVQHFLQQLNQFIADHPDDPATAPAGHLRQVSELAAGTILVQSLNGFTQSLVMRRQSLQLPVAVGPPSLNPSQAYQVYARLTQEVQPIVTGGDSAESVGANTVSPMADANNSYNPIRAGHLKLGLQAAGEVGLQAVDAFGAKRSIDFTDMISAASITALVDGNPLPAIAYLPPRLAQPARLLFRWIAADSAGLDEMNSHPATSPVCGWLLPDHLSIGFFVYDPQGKPLGHLALSGDKKTVEWQSVPGDDATINQPVDQVLAHSHPQLLALAVALKEDADYFAKFWQAVDSVHGTINPATLAVNSGLGVLIGRPVALVQASLRLEVKGRPALDQGLDALQAVGDTEHAFTGVRFPVLLGDAKQWDDGLIGFFKTNGGGFDLRTFYTEGGDAPVPGGTPSGVIQPVQDTITLTVTPKPDASEPPVLAPDTVKVLMLADPRARVHATMGILPTQTLAIPPDVAADALSRLEISFLAAPVLKGRAGLAIPAPSMGGFELSWVEQVGSSGAPEWAVTPQIDPPSGGGVWAYTPQLLSEGWLRFNPAVVEFSLLDATGRPLVTRGQTAVLTVKLVNRKPGSAIRFDPGTLVHEGDDPQGSIVYFHFGKLVAQDDVPKIALTCDGWTFLSLSDARYGQYWAATPGAGNVVALKTGASLTITVAGLIPTSDTDLVQCNVYFDYYALGGVGDGVYAELVGIADGAG